MFADPRRESDPFPFGLQPAPAAPPGFAAFFPSSQPGQHRHSYSYQPPTPQLPRTEPVYLRHLQQAQHRAGPLSPNYSLVATTPSLTDSHPLSPYPSSQPGLPLDGRLHGHSPLLRPDGSYLYPAPSPQLVHHQHMHPHAHASVPLSPRSSYAGQLPLSPYDYMSPHPDADYSLNSRTPQGTAPLRTTRGAEGDPVPRVVGQRMSVGDASP